MSESLIASLATTSQHGDSPALMLDAASYAQRVLLQNRAIPWRDATAYSNHLGQTQALLAPACALIPLDRMIVEALEHRPELRAAMGEKSRAGFAARALLADEGLRAQAKELVDTAAKTQREPVILQLPSLLSLLTLADRAVDSSSEHEFDDDDAENTAMHFADWLRTLANCALAGIIFDERERESAAESWSPIRNIAEHYRWPIGSRTVEELRFTDGSVPVLDSRFLVDEEFLGEFPAGALLFLEVPEYALPERVLSRLDQIRGR